MAFMSSTKPSRDVFRISGGVCAGKVSLKCADEYNLHIPSMDTCQELPSLSHMNLSLYICIDMNHAYRLR